jgi:DNA-binding PadR family transcriptional regulator
MSDLSSAKLTTPDLVLLSLLAERPMHGYEANALLEFRHVREWAAVSRPQVYYSLEKLSKMELIVAMEAEGGKPGPDRRVFATTAEGRASLAEALGREEWTGQLERPLFLTWLALSWQCRPGVVGTQLERRRQFVEKTLREKNETLADVLAEVGHSYHEAVWMLKLLIAQLESERKWLEEVALELPRRAAARNPAGPEP